jgi:hypothetical protein
MSVDQRHLRPLSQVEVEDRIQDVIERMERDTEEYDDIAKAAAEAEADYRLESGRARLAIIQHGEKMTVGERDARVDVMTHEAHKNYLIRAAARNSKREHLLTLRAHLDSLRTLNASIRNQT